MLACDELAKIVAGSVIEIETQRQHTFLDVGQSRDLANSLVDASDRLRRHLGRSGDAEPSLDMKSWHRILGNRRHLRQDSQSLPCRNPEGLYLPLFHERHHGDWCRPDKRNLPAEQVAKRRRAAAI